MYFSKNSGTFIFGLIFLVQVHGGIIRFREYEFKNDDESTFLKLVDKVGKIILSENVEIEAKNVSATEFNKFQNERKIDEDAWITINNSFNIKFEEMQKEFKAKEQKWEAAVNALEEVQKEFREKKEEWKLERDFLISKMDAGFKVLKDEQRKISDEIEDGKTKGKKYLAMNDIVEKRRSGYINTPGIGSHKLYYNNKTWDEAKMSCLMDGAYLTIINSDEEAELLAKMVELAQDEINQYAEKAERAWIGAHNQNKKWLTVYEEEAEYLKWGTYGGNQEPWGSSDHNCVVLYSFNKIGMGTWICSDTYAYICEL